MIKNFKYWLTTLLCSAVTLVMAQQQQGTVSFVTSQNVYIKVASTDMIEVGDTVFISKENGLQPALIVTAKSTISVVTTPLSDLQFTKGQKVTLQEKKKEMNSIFEPKKNTEIDNQSTEEAAVQKTKKISASQKQRIDGRISTASYSTISLRDSLQNHRLMERFSLDIDHINDSDFSLETYFNWNQNYNKSNGPLELQSKRFRVYNLAISYTPQDKYRVVAGRQINRNMSSIGAVDGLQFEKNFGKVTLGGIAGSKPDLTDYGFNLQMGQFGLFAANELDLGANLRMSSTLGFINQTNQMKTDRRYAYLQHYSTLFKKLNFFTSAELDVYSGAADTVNVGPRLTNLYLSARYRMTKKLTAMLSYDQRKRVIYYESYQIDIENILLDDYITTGWRGRLNYKLTKNISTGLNYNTRIREDSKFHSYGGYATINKLPWVRGSVSAYYNANNSTSVTTQSISGSYRNHYFNRNLNTYYYYRYVSYEAGSGEKPITHNNYFGAKINYTFLDTYSVGVLGEYSYNKFDENLRVNIQLTKRFTK